MEQFPAPKVMAHKSINLHPLGLAQDFREEATEDSFEGLNPSTGMGSGQDLSAKQVPLFCCVGFLPRKSQNSSHTGWVQPSLLLKSKIRTQPLLQMTVSGSLKGRMSMGSI